MSPKRERRVKKLTPLTEKKVKRNILIKLLVNLGIEIIAVVILIASLMGIQTASICSKQAKNSQTKLDEIVEVVANNTEDKDTLVSQFDDLHSKKAITLANYSHNNPEFLKNLLNNETEAKESLIDTCKNCDIDSIYVAAFYYEGTEMKKVVSSYRKNAEEAKSLEFYYPDINDYVLKEDGNFKDVFTPFTYNHSEEDGKHIIKYFENDIPEGSITYRYYGADIGTFTDNNGQTYYCMIMIGTDPSAIYDQVHSLVSLKVILSDVTVGQGGYVFAVNDDGIVTYHPNSSYIGKKYNEVGLSDAVLNDNYKGWQTFSLDGKQEKMYCVTSKATESKIREILNKKYNGEAPEYIVQEVTRIYSSSNISVACVSQTEINKNRIFTSAIVGAVFILVATIQIAYLLLVKEELLVSGKQISKKLGNKLYVNDTVAKRVIPVTAIGILALIGLTIFTQCLFSLSTQIDNNKVYLKEIENVLNTNEEQTKALKEETEDLYLNKLDVIKYAAKNNKSIYDLFVTIDESTKKQSPAKTRRSQIDETTRTKNKQFLSNLAESLGVNSVYMFNIYGETVATSTNFQDFDLSTDSTHQSYAFWEVLKGHTDELVQDPMISDVEGYAQYMAKPLYSINTVDGYEVKEVVGMVQIGFTPSEYAEKIAVSDIGNVLKNMIFGTKGFAFAINKEAKTVKYFPSSDSSVDYTGKSYTTIGLPQQALSIDYFGSITFNGTRTWVSSMEYGDYYIYVAIPNNEVFSQVVNISLMTGFISLVALSLFTALYVFNPTDESLEAELVQRNKSFAIIKDSRGRERKIVTASARWGSSAMKWNTLTAGQKTSIIIRGCLVVFGAIVVTMIYTNLFDSLSIIPFIKDGNYIKGFNVFSITNAVVFGLVVVVGADLLRAIIRLALKNADARIETVGRLITNLIKYAAVIWIIFRSLSVFGIDTSALITGASVLSIIIGLGSQSLISDILAGLFIVFEGEFRVGDIVTVGDWRGTVLEIGLRTTKIEDVSKNIKILSNSNITGVINMTKEYSYAGCTIGMEYGESIERVEAILSNELPLLKDKLPAIKDGPFYKGVSSLSASSVDIKIIALCNEQDRIQLERDLNREMKLIFDRNNINVPFPQVVINERTPDMTDGGASRKIKKEAEEFVEEQREDSKGIEL